MMQKKVYFRADGNSTIGLGHVMRLLSISAMLKDDFDCIFLIKTPSEILINTLQQTCRVISLPDTNTLEEEASFIVNQLLLSPAVIILDGYHFSSPYQKILKSNSNCKLICIDDLTPLKYWADVVINHAGSLSPSDFKTVLYTKLCLGTKYAMLRKPFLEATQVERQIHDSKKLFICFGGADPLNYSKTALEASLSLIQFETIHIVLGNAYLHLEELQERLQGKQSRIVLHQNLDAVQMTSLMQSCQVALVSASGISYEAASIGMGLITILSADNQQGIFDFLTTKGLAKGILNINMESIKRQLQNLSLTDIQQQIQQQRVFFKDSSQVFLKIIHKLFSEFDINFRLAKASDMLLYFEWANDPEARQNAIYPKPIQLDTHKQWFSKKITAKNALLYYFEYQNRPLGRFRFDIAEDRYIISYSVDKKFRGRGFGELIVKKALEEISPSFDKERYFIYAEVKTDNIASQKVFEYLGFQLTSKKNYNEQVAVFCYEKRQLF